MTENTGNRVRWVSAGGLIRTVAGIGGNSVGVVATWSGPATSARLNNPTCIVSDGAGGALFADTNLNAVQRWLPNGTVSAVTYAGTGLSGTTGA